MSKARTIPAGAGVLQATTVPLILGSLALLIYARAGAALGQSALGLASQLASLVQAGVPPITSAMASWGYAGVFLLMLAESISVPIPSEAILPYTGYLVFTGRLDFLAAVLICTAAGTGGALLDYYIGWSMRGKRPLGFLIRFNLFDERTLRVVDDWFIRHASATVFFSRMVPGARTLASFPAGATRMPIGRFVGWTASGCMVWNASLIYAGMYLGGNWGSILGFPAYLGAIVLGAAALFLGAFLLLKRRRATTDHLLGRVSN